ncbi:type II secretion system protein [Sporosarcina sp. BP05]|uniref:type II secretion system protein n=1 Tax=Sporosarcina sp. BP05 TaxID=2758726 RepID=UPI00164732F2|nr:prepilin-type N-terminal cleavage/methylation domain-containing protein [Sporosarcina sp. BP05]
MNSKGLTLVEVLAVIVILSVLVLIGTVSVDKIIESSSRKVFHTNLDTLERTYGNSSYWWNNTFGRTF